MASDLRLDLLRDRSHFQREKWQTENQDALRKELAALQNRLAMTKGLSHLLDKKHVAQPERSL